MPRHIVKETIVEAYFIKLMLEAFPGAQINKYTPRRGEPDRICLLPGGVVLFVELKRLGERPRPEQERAIKRLAELGFDAFVLIGKEEVKTFVETLKLELLI